MRTTLIFSDGLDYALPRKNLFEILKIEIYKDYEDKIYGTTFTLYRTLEILDVKDQ